MSDEDESGWVLVMPFVTVTSVGGPHDDDAYVAGWEMGKLDAFLEHTKPQSLAQTVRSDNVAQADLVAMRHGYTMTVEDSMVEGWTNITLEVAQS